jgi:uncharacterized membrane protein
MALAGGFFLSPWPLEAKTHAALHGLCAQIPSHTFVMGDSPLPFDARMTGIYGGFLICFVWLAIRTNGFRFAAIPPLRVIALLITFVGLMGVDGTNSLLLDLRLPHLYTPDNLFRIITGSLSGVSLATVVGYLLAVTLWKNADYGRPVISSVRDGLMLVLLTVPFIGMVLSGASWLYEPVAIALLISAVIVVASLTFVLLLLVTKRDCRYTTFAQTDGAMAVALVIGVGVMMAIAAGRYWLEAVAGSPLGVT